MYSKRIATEYGAFEFESLPNQTQVAVTHSMFIEIDMRGQGLGRQLKRLQIQTLKSLKYDYALCTVDGQNEVQQTLLRSLGGEMLKQFSNSKTGGTTQIWGFDLNCKTVASLCRYAESASISSRTLAKL
jgi:L-amino acid N-acyltransferase YncA